MFSNSYKEKFVEYSNSIMLILSEFYMLPYTAFVLGMEQLLTLLSLFNIKGAC